MPFKKHLNNCGARLRGAQSVAAPVSRGPIRPDPQSQSDRGISALEPQYTAEPQPRNAKAASAPDIKAPRPFRHQGQGAQSVSAPRIQSAQVQNPQSKPPRENTELISFFAQALWGLATTLSVAPHSATSPSSSTRSLSASSDTSAKS